MNAGALIVGGGQAGVQIALTLRELGHQDPITIVGSEDYAPYQRPPLSKAFLTGTTGLENLFLRSDAFYERTGITVHRAHRVAQIADGVAGTDQGVELPFDRLALAVGARVRRLRIAGAELSGVCYLRDATDAQDLKRRLAEATDVVIVGGGFIGLEAAAVARAHGKNVTVVEGAPRLIPRAVGSVVSDFYRQAHERRGTHVRLNTGVVELIGRDGRVSGVGLSDGQVLPADLVIVGIGVEPRLELARHLGLACSDAIVVDGFARTSDPSVVAAGDCTTMPDPRGGEDLVRLESVQNAVDQAKCAAASMLDRSVPYTAVPWFWSDQADLKLQIAGLSGGFDETVVRGDPDSEKFSVMYYRSGVLIAIDAINQPQDYMAVRRILSSNLTVPAERAHDLDVALKDLAVPSVDKAGREPNGQ